MLTTPSCRSWRRPAPSLDVDTLPTPFGGPTLIVTGRQDHPCGYQAAWALLDDYPGATFAVLDRADHLADVEQPALSRALIGERIDRVEAATAS